MVWAAAAVGLGYLCYSDQYTADTSYHCVDRVQVSERNVAPAGRSHKTKQNNPRTAAGPLACWLPPNLKGGGAGAVCWFAAPHGARARQPEAEGAAGERPGGGGGQVRERSGTAREGRETRRKGSDHCL
eukprot:SAG22_NODE_360_length_11744_cov_37.781623_10_plen_129_part_00